MSFLSYSLILLPVPICNCQTLICAETCSMHHTQLRASARSVHVCSDNIRRHTWIIWKGGITRKKKRSWKQQPIPPTPAIRPLRTPTPRRRRRTAMCLRASDVFTASSATLLAQGPTPMRRTSAVQSIRRFAFFFTLKFCGLATQPGTTLCFLCFLKWLWSRKNSDWC